jgi:hypothetical protein
MHTKIEEQVEALRKERARQRQEWAVVRKGIAAFGDRVLAVPRPLLTQIDQACTPLTEATHHTFIRA